MQYPIVHILEHGAQYEVNHLFGFVKGIWLNRKSRQFFSRKSLFYLIRAQHVLSYHLK